MVPKVRYVYFGLSKKIKMDKLNSFLFFLFFVSTCLILLF